MFVLLVLHIGRSVSVKVNVVISNLAVNWFLQFIVGAVICEEFH